MIDLKQLHPRRWNLRLVWDAFMVWVALTNVMLIGFDLTYLMLRPQYLRFTPIVTQVYDPVKGIDAHPLTTSLLREAAEARRLAQLDPGAAGLQARVATLEQLTTRVLRENPFERAGQDLSLEVIRQLISDETGRTVPASADGEAVAQAVGLFWSDDPPKLLERLELFHTHIRPLLEVNYYREITLSGRLVDHFWLIDLPFLTLFLVEFGVRWAMAIRRREHARWFFFPIFNWYDVIGLIPYTQFRVFRLLRVASIYMRLRRSEVSRVGKDALSRAVAYVSNIISEEISDAVSLRILSEYQAELREGTHTKIIDRTIASRRHEVESVAVTQIREIVTSDEIQKRVRELVRLNLDKAARDSEAMRTVPLPAALVTPLVTSIGNVVVDAVLESLTLTLQSEEGEQAARELVGAVLEHLFAGPWRGELETLGAEIGIDVLEEMKRAVSIKKWARAPGSKP